MEWRLNVSSYGVLLNHGEGTELIVRMIHLYGGNITLFLFELCQSVEH